MLLSGRRDSIRRDIRSFVTGAFAVRFAVTQWQQDLVGEYYRVDQEILCTPRIQLQ